MSAARTSTRRLFARVGTGVAIAAAVVAGASVPAQAAPGDTTGICASSLTPSGFVDIAHYYTSSCGTGSFNKNAKTIKQIAGYPVGTSTLACGSSLTPSGWVDSAWFFRSECTISSGSTSANARTIKRVY